MTADDKKRMVLAINDFVEAFPAAVGATTEEEREQVIARFPEPTGLGTDGTCWSDDEHRSYIADVCRAANKILTAGRART